MSRKRQLPFNGFGSGQIRVLSWQYANAEYLEQHQHSWHQFIYAISGVMTVETSAGSWIVPTNRAVWVPAGTPHSIAMSGTVAMRALYLSPRLSQRLPRECRVVSVPPLLRELVLHAVANHGLTRRRPRELHLLEAIVDFVATLPADALRIEALADERAARVARLVLDSPADQASLDVLAKRAGASKRTLERTFVRETGLPFGRWRQRVRFVHALRLLAAGHPVTRVALESGYDSLSAFIARFRQMFGVTPGRYLVESGDAGG